jgi:hypothetical protein
LGEPVRDAAPLGWATLILLAVALVPTPLTAAGMGSESSLLVFPSAQGAEKFHADRTTDSGSHWEGVADILYTRTQGRLRLLAEVDFSTESAEVDRLQAGWELIPESFIWVGKFHVPSSSWNFERDHGHYLQTAISTPAIETPGNDRWGDDTGVLPENVSGVLLDSSHAIGTTAAMQFSLGVGVAPNPVPDTHSYWVSPERGGRHRIGWNARFALLPDYSRTNSFGLLASRHKLDTTALANESVLLARDVEETTYGAYADGDWGLWGIRASVYRIDFRLLGLSTPRAERIVAGYAQLERRFAGQYTAFARFENSAWAREADYLQALQPRFEVRRSLIGMRWDFIRHEAITVEFARAATLTDRFTHISLQWSAVIP